MSTWLKDKGSTLAAVAGAIAALVAVLQLSVVGPMSQRFDAMERYVNQRFNDMNQRLDTMERSMNQRFDAQDKYVNQRFDAMDQRFDAQDRRLENLEHEVSELRKVTTGIAERVPRNEAQIEVIRAQIKTVDAP